MNRGEIWFADLDPVKGSEQAGTRPVLIFQSDPLNSFLRTVVLIPLTTNLKWSRFPFCVLVNAGEGGLPSDSVVLCHQIRVSDKSRLKKRIGQISNTTLEKIEKAVKVTLGT